MKLLDLHNLNQKRLKALHQSGIESTLDLLYLFPRRYIDKSNIQPIKTLYQFTEPVTIVGKVKSKKVAGYKNKRRLEVLVQDHSGFCKAVFFKGWKYFINLFEEDSWVSLYGKAKKYGSFMSMAHPDVEQIENLDEMKIPDTLIPIYPSNKHFSKAYISNKIITGWIQDLLDSLTIQDFLPREILTTNNFYIREEAFQTIHQPKSRQEALRALDRFKFEEFFLFELSMMKIKMQRIERASGIEMEAGEFTKKFFNKILPFQLTEGQRTSLTDIKEDLNSGKQMNRLLQGDVGSGKTIVAIGSILMAVDNGWQTAFMAPTEILAEQHYYTLKEYLEPLGINIRLFTGGQSSALRTDILSDIAGGNCQITVGTHAIFQEKVSFNNLGLVVIDEQHRFGVKQRNELLRKGGDPHLLVMSATPIPRSLAMTIYSDLDISVIKELPAGRKPVKTAIRSDSERESVYRFVKQQVSEGDQVYVIFPLIEESEVMDLKDATMGFEKLKQHFPKFSIDLLHGQMDSKEKEAKMRHFSEGKTQILVSTTVIEVGVDVPNATIMMIEHAERFGLSQLHQLRGRIGRGEKQSYCILLPDQKLTESAKYRLKKMVQTSDGFLIAEADLKLRGPGDFLGTKQSGLPEFRYADIIEDRMLLESAKNSARSLIEQDPQLKSSRHQKLNEVFTPYYKKRKDFFGIG